MHGSKKAASQRQFNIPNIPSNPAERRAWVLYQLKLRGLSLSSIAREEGVVQQAVSNALLIPSSHLEEAIARAIDVPVRDLFPERFAADGRRLNPTRSRNRISAPDACNVESAGVA